MPTKQDLSKRKVGPWLAATLTDWGLIVVSMAFAIQVRNIFVTFLAILIIGSRIHALSILGHDGAHRLISSNRKLNDFLTNFFCFWPMGICLDAYRYFHFKHHRLVGTNQDPELPARALERPDWDVPTTKEALLKQVIRDLFGFNVRFVYVLIKTINPKSCVKTSQILKPYFLQGSLILMIIFCGYYEALLLWIVSLSTSFVAVFRLRGWFEHIGTKSTHRLEMPWWLAWFVAPHNTWYHWEHHEYSYVPFWRLKEARKWDRQIPVADLKTILKLYKTSPAVPSGEQMAA